MPRPRRSYRTRARAPRARYAWSGFVSDPANVNPAGLAASNLLSGFTQADLEGSTLVRMVGSVRVWPGDASNISEGVMGIIGMPKETADAGAFPEPLTDTGSRWMWWKRFLTGTQATGELGTGLGATFDLDIKLNFRVPGVQGTVQLLVENDDGTHTFLFAVGIRSLLKLA